MLQEKIEELQDKIGAGSALRCFQRHGRSRQAQRDPPAGARRLSEQGRSRGHARPSGVLLPDDAPELPETTPKPRAELASG